MYCGSCLRDNALATELIARGHDVSLLPIYTPTLTDEPNVSGNKVFFGGISVYLEQYLPFFRHTPKWLDRLWDSRMMLQLASRRSISTSPKMLGELTVSMLKGNDGFQRKEIEKLVEWLRHEGARHHQLALHAAHQPRTTDQRGLGSPRLLHASGRRSFPRRFAGAISQRVEATNSR